MYPLLLSFHNIFRWVVVLLALWAFLQFLAGWIGRRPWLPSDGRVATFFTISMDIQLLLGLILYFFYSDVTARMMSDFGAGMRDPQIRYFGMEHALVMLLAVVFAHIGGAKAKKGPDGARLRNGAIFFGLALLMIAVRTPWTDRPLWRLMF